MDKKMSKNVKRLRELVEWKKQVQEDLKAVNRKIYAADKEIKKLLSQVEVGVYGDLVVKEEEKKKKVINVVKAFKKYTAKMLIKMGAITIKKTVLKDEDVMEEQTTITKVAQIIDPEEDMLQEE